MSQVLKCKDLVEGENTDETGNFRYKCSSLFLSNRVL